MLLKSMSIESNRQEAMRWYKTAEGDLDAALILNQNEKYAHACFLCQQAAEKALKSLYYLHDADPWRHSIYKLIDELQQIDITLHKKFLLYSDDARHLDKLYIPTRYPNGLPDITPSVAYSSKDSEDAIASARKIVSAVKALIP